MMDDVSYDLIIRIIGAIGVGVAGFTAVWNTTLGWRKNVKEEYAFARDFFAVLTKEDIHPLVRERGYQALAGTRNVSASEVEFLLQLDPSGASMKDYLMGRQCLLHVGVADHHRFQFKAKYRTKFARRARKTVSFVLYMLFVLMAVSPLFLTFIAPKAQVPNLYIATLATFACFTPLAWLVLQSALKISRAEAIVARQSMQAPVWRSTQPR